MLDDERGGHVTNLCLLCCRCFVFVFFTSAKDLHNSALTVLRADKSERRQFGGGSKDPRGRFTAARLAAVQGSSHQRSLDPSSSRHKVSSKPLFFSFLFFYTPTTTQRVKHIPQRANAAAAALCWHSLEMHYSFQKGWICNCRKSLVWWFQCHMFTPDWWPIACSVFLGCFLVQMTSLSFSEMSQKKQLSHAGLCQAISGKKRHKVLKWLTQCSQPLAGTSFFGGWGAFRDRINCRMKCSHRWSF